MRTNPRWFLVMAGIGLLLAGCGGSDTASGPDTASSDPDTASSDDVEDDAPDTQPEPPADESGGGGTTGATVTVGSEVFSFSMDGDLGVCIPELSGRKIFQVSLYQDGNSDEGHGLQLSLLPNPDGTLASNSLVRVGEIWVAEADSVPGSQVDTATITGNHAEGTATFSNFDGIEPVSGTFEVTCAGT